MLFRTFAIQKVSRSDPDPLSLPIIRLALPAPQLPSVIATLQSGAPVSAFVAVTGLAYGSRKGHLKKRKKAEPRTRVTHILHPTHSRVIHLRQAATPGVTLTPAGCPTGLCRANPA